MGENVTSGERWWGRGVEGVVEVKVSVTVVSLVTMRRPELNDGAVGRASVVSSKGGGG